MLGENCFVVSDDTRQAVVIDCGAFYPDEQQTLAEYIKHEQLEPVHLLCTHGHLDHCFGNHFLYEQFGLKPEVHAADDWLISNLPLQAATMFGFQYNEETTPVAHWLTNGEQITFGTHSLEVLSTPGHTPGSVLFYCADEGVVFSGDTLFRGSIGRTDFERGSWDNMMKSLQLVVKRLPPSTTVYCGHGPQTTIAEELRSNPFLR